MPAAIVSFIAAGSLCAQDLNFPGVTPFVILNASLNKKVDLNVLSLSKIRVGEHIIDGVKYDPGPLQIYTHAIFSYKITGHWQAGAGFAFQRNNPFRDDWKNDYRLLQQVVYILQGSKWKLSSRLRVEERWFRFPDASGSFGTRLKQQNAFTRQLNGEKFYWQAVNELYAIPSGARNSFVSENWFYTGLGVALRSFGRWDNGFGWNTMTRNTKHDLTNLFFLQTMLTITFHRHEKEVEPEMESGHF
ncbi:MAG: DUF2490 domain-containing protein [Bacteroidota bacterium]|nr:DUF2490 domain-containing protein [Bacteroidota bacterium]